jgi:hypothetical protein
MTTKPQPSAPGGGDVLSAMHKADFIRTLRRAHEQAPGSEDAVKLEIWAARLLPYLDREPGVTVADALKKYHERG